MAPDALAEAVGVSGVPQHDHCKESGYGDFTPSSGRAVHRWAATSFSTANVPLRLAEDGEDVGLLVTSAGDARDELVGRALAVPQVALRDRVVRPDRLHHPRRQTNHGH